MLVIYMVLRLMSLRDGFSRARAYFACLLNLDELFNEQLPALHVGQSNNYYVCALRSKSKQLCLPALSAKRYAQLALNAAPEELPQIEDASVHDQPLDDGPDFEAPLPVCDGGKHDDVDVGDFDDGSNMWHDPIPIACAPAPEPGKDEALMLRLINLQQEWLGLMLPDVIEGIASREEFQLRPSRGPPYLRRRVTCACGWTRSRNYSTNGKHGLFGVYSFLAVWLRACRRMSADEHKVYKPTPAELDAYVAEHMLS